MRELANNEGPQEHNPKTFKIKCFKNSKSQEGRERRVDKCYVDHRDSPPMDTRPGFSKYVLI